MIRCQNCGAQLGLLDEKCPYCGSENPEAKRHVEELKHYQNDYEDTKEIVHDKVHAYSKSYALLAILVILLLVFIGLCMILGSSYELFSYHQKKEYKTQEASIERVLRDYIEAEDYERFVLYYEDKTDGIYGLDYDGIDRFYHLAYNYLRLKENLLNHQSSTIDHIDYLSTAADAAKWFFEDYMRFEMNHPNFKDAEKLYLECQDFLKVQLNFSEEDFKELEADHYKGIYEMIYRGAYEE